MIRLGKDVFNIPVPSGMRSFSLQQKILPVAGRVAKVILHFVGGKKNVTELFEQDVLNVLPAALPYVGEIFAEMPEGELEKITRILLGPSANGLPGATMNNKQLFGGPDGDLFDSYMQGRTIETWQLLWHALEVWYPDFFTRARSLLVTGAKENPSEESSISAISGPAIA